MKQEIDLNKLPFKELKIKLEELEKKKLDVSSKNIGVWNIGKNYVIRTVTMIQIGKLIDVTDNELVMTEASWIADTGRWTNFLREGVYDECEPFPDDIIVGRNSIIDATIWKHKLPKEQK